MDLPELSPEDLAALPAHLQRYIRALKTENHRLAEENRQFRLLIKSKSLSGKSRLRVARLSGRSR